MSIDKFLQDGQDAKVVEKIHDKIVDMLTGGEFIQYISVQKKPAVTLLPDSITVSNKRIFLCEFTKLGFATNFEIFSWSDIKDIAFKEEIFGCKVTVIPAAGENLTIDYIPKVQARKLYQLIKQALEQPPTPLAKTSGAQPSEAATRPATVEHVVAAPERPQSIPPTGPMPAVPTTPEKEYSPSVPAPADTQAAANRDAGEDELTQKLRKLKTLYDRQLITQAEYENKKSELLSQL
ncbi:MAG TPA: PH domain-containing protein [Sphingobacterium sp.]|nr:PH domain-containing protein [Sphingobacterium sp.]